VCGLADIPTLAYKSKLICSNKSVLMRFFAIRAAFLAKTMPAVAKIRAKGTGRKSLNGFVAYKNVGFMTFKSDHKMKTS